MKAGDSVTGLFYALSSGGKYYLPHSCRMCAKTFRDGYCLKEHENSVHFKRCPHRCPNCGKGFAYRQNMNRHTLTCARSVKLKYLNSLIQK